MKKLSIAPGLSLPLEAVTQGKRRTNGRGIDLSLPIDEAERASLLERLEGGSSKGGECWLWTRSTKNGYGQISVHDRPTYVHQLSYAIHHGVISDGSMVCHTCDVRLCWRPAHLFLGDATVNVRDMWAKGRASRPPIARGERNHNATLNDQQVAEIRDRWRQNQRDQRALAREFGCSQSTIWRLVHGIVRDTKGAA